MSKSEFIKLSGLVFMTGSLAFITILSSSDSIAIPGSTISALLLAAGLFILRAGYGETVNPFGRNILLLGGTGAILWETALAVLIAVSTSGSLHATQAQGERFWIVVFGGPAVALLALILFGLTALNTKPMPRMNGLPILAAIWYPVVYSFLFVYLISHNGILPDQYWPVVRFTFVIQFLALCWLGFTLFIDSAKELAAA